MITFDQQVMHTETTNGDCTRAVVYTLAQKDLDLPHPINDKREWNLEFFHDLENKGYHLDYFPREKDHWPRFVGRSGISPRGVRHLVVWDREKNEMFHDPHPSRGGVTDYDGWFVLRELK